MSKTPRRWNARWGSCASAFVINSDSTVEFRHTAWHHIGDSAYFTDQWNKALELFDGDVLFHIQADASYPNFAAMFERCRFAVGLHNCGVDAPNVDYTKWEYNRRKLRRLNDDLLEVAQTDCTCWAISREVLDRLPPVDPLRRTSSAGESISSRSPRPGL